MRYQQPYGVADQNASYINGNPAAGIMGSIPPAAAFEQPMREIVACISNSDLIPSDSDLQQLLKSIRRQFLNFAIDTGAVNSLVIALTPPLDVYHAGIPLRVLVAVTNTGPTVINVNGLGSRNIVRGDGSALHAGDLVAGMIANMVDTGSVFQLQNPLLGVASSSNTYNVDIPYCVDTSTTANQIIAPFLPAITSMTEGKFISVRVANTNSGPVTIAVNALAAIPICRDDGSPMQAGDIMANEQILLENHSSYYQFMGLVRSQVVLPPAPKLFGMRAWLESNSTMVPISHNLFVPFDTMDFANLGDAVWGMNPGTLTIGPKTAGIWQCNLFVAFSNYTSTNCPIATCGIENSRTATFALGCQGFTGNGGGFGVGCSGTTKCVIGDQITMVAYHQNPSAPLPIGGGHTYFEAYMISI